MLINILKGIIIGIANIIPGVSGGTIAVSMGIYNKLISCITNLFKDFKNSIKTLLPYGIGMILGICVFAFVITFLFEHAPVPTNFLFVGLVLGGIPLIYQGIKGHKITFIHVMIFLIFATIVIYMGTADATQPQLNIKLDFVEILKLVLVGVVAAATMVIPGVSGSMMLTLLGYYQPITSCIKDLVKGLAAFDFNAILSQIGILLPFLVGVVIGIFGIAKLIEFLLKKCPSYVYACILGLIVASPVAILSKVTLTGLEIPTIMLSIVTLSIGIIVSVNLGKE